MFDFPSIGDNRRGNPDSDAVKHLTGTSGRREIETTGVAV